MAFRVKNIWALTDYTSITPKTNFKYLDAFCDSKGNVNNDFPRSGWDISFKEENASTFVDIAIKHENLSDLEKIIEMGFKKDSLRHGRLRCHF